ncbi:acetyl-CoA carboxylase biotin carboxylase subunit [Williamsia sp. CHRR-6]|uniref:acetyl-CoA carboxylase biotin carboxylase subunit n=1 Tax=Williamsia sp. CHRR-6 TaxID=2835871 RepID=UPI001BDA8C13|nr:acetyl-CoA carboxylase biotin carboxylase subunit [Williamsia sp. CHRR-6]MBT0567409.1 acetyl-CoA carboxylase biotin carboxylase subunit [Williamsia sp. CHRR-6]
MTDNPRTIRTVLIANRGEIAVRICRTLRQMGIRSVAVYSDADAGGLHVAAADEAVHIGPAAARESYLDIDRIIAAARATGADAIHPGYGFLSENASFVSACDAAGLIFIGPDARAMTVMGDKITAKNTVAAHGVPVVPGIARPGLTDDELIAAADDVGYPVLVKPSAGGGGKGMRVVTDPAGLAAALVSARREAASSFGDDTLFLERFVLQPRHIEVQILADAHGHVIHLGERECSLQRRHQKVIEEAPSPLLDAATRARIGAAACDTARSVGYRGAGTVEFIVSATRPDEFFFMEMNTRLQVEHPVTELVTGIDLVQWQIRVARGERLDIDQADVTLSGHAVEARLYAEDPAAGFIPTGGTLIDVLSPSGPGVRMDSGIVAGSVISSHYDPMLAKIIAHGSDRATALDRLDDALAQTATPGVVTNAAFLRHLLANNEVRAGHLDTALLDRIAQNYPPPPSRTDEQRAVTAAAALHWLTRWADAGTDPWGQPSGWRALGACAPTVVRLQVDPDQTYTVAITGSPQAATVSVDDGPPVALTATVENRPPGWSPRAHSPRLGLPATNVGGESTGGELRLTVDGHRTRHHVADDGVSTWVTDRTGARCVRPAPSRTAGRAAAVDDTELRSPMPGTVIAVGAEHGETVTAATVVVVVEAMKMEHSLTAPIDGVVDLLVAAGDQVGVGQPLARIHPPQPDAARKPDVHEENPT